MIDSAGAQIEADAVAAAFRYQLPDWSRRYTGPVDRDARVYPIPGDMLIKRDGQVFVVTETRIFLLTGCQSVIFTVYSQQGDSISETEATLSLDDWTSQMQAYGDDIAPLP